MKKYNVLWIEDEPEKQDGFEDQAFLEDVFLFQFSTSKSGIEELQANLESYDAIVLDAKGFEESEDELAGLSGLQNSIKAINALSVKKPYFIFSGYLDQEEYGVARDMLKNEEIFKKGSDNQRLFQRIKEEADKQIDTQIRHENQLLFNAIEDYSKDDKKTILQILKAVKTGGSDLSDNLYFTPIRLILEQMFRKANKVGLVHDKCVQVKGNQVNLTESSKFISGQDCDILKVRSTQTHTPKIIADHIKNLLFITGTASHTSEVNVTKNLDVQAYREEINSPYLLYSLLFMLSDVLIWFHQYASKNGDEVTNKGFWEDLDYHIISKGGKDFPYKWEKAVVLNVFPNGWANLMLKDPVVFSQVSVYKDTVSDKNLSEGDEVRVVWNTTPPQSKEIERT